MATPFRVKAVFEYSSPHDDDLSFPNGQIITVTEEEDDDWYFGEYNDDGGKKFQGLFPRNFVERYEPTTPPRPSRPARSKKEAEPVEDAAPVYEMSAAPVSPTVEESVAFKGKVVDSPSIEPEADNEEIDQGKSQPTEHVPPPAHEKALESTPITSAVPAPVVATKPPIVKKAPAPTTAEKPAVGSFRDRIAAFNKGAAPPVPPAKLGGFGSSSGSGFVKKTFVPPPPSRNAYVPPPREPPPQKIYRREEDPDIVAQSPPDVDESRPPVQMQEEKGEDQPKPTTLKERIALLQKQQLEQAARNTEALQKKEKPKRPPKQRTESYQQSSEQVEEEVPDRQQSISKAHLVETEDDETQPVVRPKKRSKSKDRTPLASPISAPHELLSDTNDADQSAGGDTEDGETTKPSTSHRPHDTPALPSRGKSIPNDDAMEEKEDEAVEEEEEEGEEEDDAEEMDPEVRRRMEIRERMAKMSGGMGMAGMFGAPGGLPPMPPKKSKASGGSAKKREPQDEEEAAESSSAQPVPVMALPGMSMPGMRQVRSPEQVEKQLEAPVEQPKSSVPVPQDDEPGYSSEEEPQVPAATKARKSEDSSRAPPPVPQERPPPASPSNVRAAPPPVPSERRVPPLPPPAESRPLPPPPSETQPMSPSSGSESDDEMSLHPKQLSVNTTLSSEPSRRGPPPIPSATRPTEPPPRLKEPQSPPGRQDEAVASPMSPRSPESPNVPGKRSSRVPPIPGAAATFSPAPQARAPPPPVPSQEPPRIPKPKEESEEEVTEYEGDYDTDIAVGAKHKDALKSHNQSSSTDDGLTGDEASYHHPGLPSLGPPSAPPPIPTAPAPRGVPPPPPSQPPRQSTDMPRGAPPPPPAPKQGSYDDDYDPYSYMGSKQIPTSRNNRTNDPVITPTAEEEYDDLYSTSPPRESKSRPRPSQAPPTVPPTASYSSPPLAPPSAPPPSMPRQSLDVTRTNTSRRSMDAARPSVDQSFIADDVDLGQNTQWWAQRQVPPPVFQNRNDILFEIEESSQQNSITKRVHVLFIDYSQTTITAHFDAKDPSRAQLQQHHEPPPNRLRQDQLEAAHGKYGSHIAEMANGKSNSVVGNGSPFALVTDILSQLSGSLPPVGTRAYGALIYTNLANATVQQNDEIRPGDIISFRNAKLQGHRGPMKQKYHGEVGKPDHVGIVVDWDGTKKKVRAWEQGRESKKVKIESFKLSDLRSGEVKVWRVMSTEWVGWNRRS